MKPELQSASEVAALLASSYPNARVVGIDGCRSAGKTWLGDTLARSTEATVVSVDGFIIPDRRTYVPNLRTDDLARCISSTLGMVLVVGVCLLGVLEAVSVQADVLIYVKRMSLHGWGDQDECDPSEGIEYVIDRLHGEEELFHEDGMHPLCEEIVRYH